MRARGTGEARAAGSGRGAGQWAARGARGAGRRALERRPGRLWNSTKRYETLQSSCGSRESRSSIQNSSPAHAARRRNGSGTSGTRGLAWGRTLDVQLHGDDGRRILAQRLAQHLAEVVAVATHLLGRQHRRLARVDVAKRQRGRARAPRVARIRHHLRVRALAVWELAQHRGHGRRAAAAHGEPARRPRGGRPTARPLCQGGVRARSLVGSEVPARRPGPRRRGGQSGVSGSTRLPPALAHGGRAAVEPTAKAARAPRKEPARPPQPSSGGPSCSHTRAAAAAWAPGGAGRARARARGRAAVSRRARGAAGGAGARTDDGRAGETRRLRGRGLACRPGSPARKRRSEQRLCARQCARGGLKRAPTRAGAACESERAQRGRKAACRLASHRRGRAPARLPRQREARGARQRVALCLGIAAAGSPTRLLPPSNWRRGGLCGSCQGILGWVNGFATRRKRLVQANACSGRPPRAPAMGRAAGGPAHHGRSCGRSREGVPPRRNPLAIGALFTRVSIVRLGSPWWVLQSSLTLCAARDQRVPAGKSGRSLRLGAPPLLLIEGVARCRRRTRLTTHRVGACATPTPLTLRTHVLQPGASARFTSLWRPPFGGWPRWVPRGRRSVGGAAGSSPCSRAAPCARLGRGLGLGRLPG